MFCETLYEQLCEYEGGPDDVDWRVETPEGNAGIHAKSNEVGGFHISIWNADLGEKGERASVDTDANAHEVPGSRHGGPN